MYTPQAAATNDYGLDPYPDHLQRALEALPWAGRSPYEGRPTQARKAPRTPRPPNRDRMALEALEEAQAPVRVLLSNSHTSPRYVVQSAVGAPFVRARVYGARQPRVNDCARGSVVSFSERSRRRLMALAATVKTSAMMRALFVTLTYPAEYNGDGRVWKRDLDVFMKRVRRKWPTAALVWKLEFQERGAPHFHFIILNVPYMAHQWVNAAWHEVLAGSEQDAEYVRTEVRRVKRQSQIMSYVSKYVAKPGTDVPTDYTGRFWGVSGRENLPVELREAAVSKDCYEAVLETMKNIVDPRRTEIDQLTWANGLWLAVDQRTKRRILRPLG